MTHAADAAPRRTVAPNAKMVFVPLEGNLTPEEQHAKMMERLDEMSGEPKQQKPGEGRKRTTRKRFLTQDIRIKYMRDIYNEDIIVNGSSKRGRTPWI